MSVAVADDVYIRSGSGSNIIAQTFNTYQYIKFEPYDAELLHNYRRIWDRLENEEAAWACRNMTYLYIIA